MKEIKLTQNQVALVDDDVFEYLSLWKWYAVEQRGRFYARRSNSRKALSGSPRNIHIHRVILEYYGYDLKNKQVDHINGNPLDNRLENLRACTAGENSWNAGPRKDNTSGFKGVSWQKDVKKWRSYIKFESVQIHLGLFESPEAAAFAYNVAASMLHQEFAFYNPIVVLPTQSQIQTALQSN